MSSGKGKSGLGKAPGLWFAELALGVRLIGDPCGAIRAARANCGQKLSSLPECFCYPLHLNETQWGKFGT